MRCGVGQALVEYCVECMEDMRRDERVRSAQVRGRLRMRRGKGDGCDPWVENGVRAMEES